jgi:D-proline reductase (dithiol)-stabilizing protein PrdD
MQNEIELRKLLIKTFHITKVELSKETSIAYGTLYLRRDLVKETIAEEEPIKDLKILVINPDKRDIYVNTIMDFSPIAVKVLGKIGDGITHVLTGVIVMLNGVDENGEQAHEFGSSEGILQDMVTFNKAGTPASDDIIIAINVLFKVGEATRRAGITAAHRACDLIVQEIRSCLKKMNGKNCDERYEYYDKIKLGKKKVVIVKQVTGQGCMYDTRLFGEQPGGFNNGRSIIDMGNMPVLVSPNEYRDGILRALN